MVIHNLKNSDKKLSYLLFLFFQNKPLTCLPLYCHSIVKQLCWWALTVNSVNSIPQQQPRLNYFSFRDAKVFHECKLISWSLSIMTFLSILKHAKDSSIKHMETRNKINFLYFSFSGETVHCSSLWLHIHSSSIASCLPQLYWKCSCKGCPWTTECPNPRDTLHILFFWNFVNFGHYTPWSFLLFGLMTQHPVFSSLLIWLFFLTLLGVHFFSSYLISWCSRGWPFFLVDLNPLYSSLVFWTTLKA